MGEVWAVLLLVYHSKELDSTDCSMHYLERFFCYVFWNTILLLVLLFFFFFDVCSLEYYPVEYYPASSSFFFWRLHYFLYIILKWRDVINWNSWFLATVKGFSKGLLLFKQIFFMKIKTDFNKSWYFMCQILTWEVLDPPTHSRQFDGNCGKIRYVRDP